MVKIDQGFQVAKLYIDASFAAYPDFKLHSDGCLLLSERGGAPISGSMKQKLNTRSSTVAEVVGVDYFIEKVIWFQYFMEAQGFALGRTTLFQDNQIAMLLETKGKVISTKRTPHINIRYFHIADLVAKGRVNVEYCNTRDMVGDFFTKPLQGAQFLKFRKLIPGESRYVGTSRQVVVAGKASLRPRWNEKVMATFWNFLAPICLRCGGC